jgi:hypothetical protein
MVQRRYAQFAQLHAQLGAVGLADQLPALPRLRYPAGCCGLCQARRGSLPRPPSSGALPPLCRASPVGQDQTVVVVVLPLRVPQPRPRMREWQRPGQMRGTKPFAPRHPLSRRQASEGPSEDTAPKPRTPACFERRKPPLGAVFLVFDLRRALLGAG